MLNLFRVCLRLTTVAVLLPLTVAQAQTEDTVAYCDSPLYAVNVYRDDSATSAATDLKIRVFWREKALIFADLPAQRSQFFNEGYTYTSQSGGSNTGSDFLWTLFVPEREGQACLLFRDGAALDSGDVTRRQ